MTATLTDLDAFAMDAARGSAPGVLTRDSAGRRIGDNLSMTGEEFACHGTPRHHPEGRKLTETPAE
jgi:hypothetical protein